LEERNEELATQTEEKYWVEKELEQAQLEHGATRTDLVRWKKVL